MRTLLLDGDVFAYQASAGVEEAINWGDGTDDDRALWTLHADSGQACDIMDSYIAELVQFIGADRVIIALSDDKNFRKDILPTYKANRANVRKPLCLATVRQYLRNNYDVWQRPGLEGDDVLGILLTSPHIIKGEKICVSIDKDMRTLPGLHLNQKKRHDGIFEVTQEEADRFHLLQTLVGDQVDGYTGCPGVGLKVAEDFLDNPYMLVPEEYLRTNKETGEKKPATRWRKQAAPSIWAGIVSLFLKAGYTEAYALQQARVARILRNVDYDFENKEPILWTPPGTPA